MMVISAEPETLQKIENVNANCCKLLGYSRGELMEKTLNHIIPEFIVDFHTKLLTKRSKNILYSQHKNLSTRIYVVNSSAFVEECKLGILQMNSITGRRWTCTF